MTLAHSSSLPILPYSISNSKSCLLLLPFLLPCSHFPFNPSIWMHTSEFWFSSRHNITEHASWENSLLMSFNKSASTAWPQQSWTPKTGCKMAQDKNIHRSSKWLLHFILCDNFKYTRNGLQQNNPVYFSRNSSRVLSNVLRDFYLSLQCKPNRINFILVSGKSVK